MPTEVIVSEQFYRDAGKLRKRYPNILRDVRGLREQLQAGERPGDRLQGLRFTAYKVRIKNSDAQRGKSGGYRTIYYVETVDKIAVVTIYSKSEQSDIPTEVLRRIIEEYESSNR